MSKTVNIICKAPDAARFNFSQCADIATKIGGKALLLSDKQHKQEAMDLARHYCLEGVQCFETLESYTHGRVKCVNAGLVKPLFEEGTNLEALILTNIPIGQASIGIHFSSKGVRVLWCSGTFPELEMMDETETQESPRLYPANKSGLEPLARLLFAQALLNNLIAPKERTASQDRNLFEQPILDPILHAV